MNQSINRWRAWGWLSLAVTSALWVWLLAILPIYTAAMGKAAALANWLWVVWSGSDDMGHGPFLPLVSLYVLILRRKDILAAMGRPDWRGVVLALAGAFVFWLGLNTEEIRFYLAVLVFWVWAVPFAIWGGGVARQLVFPAGYLLLSIPRWDLVAVFTLKLRLLAATVAVAIANGIGIATERIGTGLHSSAGGGFNLDVAEPCSGLRSLFAMTALAGAYAFFTQQGLWRKWLLFACAAPVAVIGNIARIVAITIVAAWLGEKKATGFYHDYSGYLVFLVAILLLVELGRIIARLQLPEWMRKTRAAFGETAPSAPHRPFGRSAVLLVFPPLILLACGMMVRLDPPVRLGSVDFLPAALPGEIGAWRGSALLYCHNEQCMNTFTEEELKAKGVSPLPGGSEAAPSSEPWIALRDLRPRYRCPVCETGELFDAGLGERQILSGDTCLLRSRYSDNGLSRFTVTMVISGFSRNSLHNPQLCLPSQGLTMDRVDTKVIPAGDGKSISVKVVHIEKSDVISGQMSRWTHLYWFFSKDRQTSSVVARMFWTAWARAFHHRSDRWVMVTVLSDQGCDAGSPAEARLFAFSGALMEKLRVPENPSRARLD